MPELLDILLPEAERGLDDLERVRDWAGASVEAHGFLPEFVGIVVREVARGCGRCLDVWRAAQPLLRRGGRADFLAQLLRDPVARLGRARELADGILKMFRSLGVELSPADRATLENLARETETAYIEAGRLLRAVERPRRDMAVPDAPASGPGLTVAEVVERVRAAGKKE